MIFFADCGIGSDPNSTGPCTGTMGPEALGQAVTGTLGPGQVALLAIGGAVLVLLAVLLLLRMLRRATGSDKPKASKGEPDADFHPFGLSEGTGYCMACDFTYEVDPDDAYGACPICHGDDDLSRESAAEDVAEPDSLDESGEAECPGCRELVMRDSMRDGMCAACAADLDGEETAGVECPGCRELVKPESMQDGMCASCAADMDGDDQALAHVQPCSICGAPTPVDQLHGELFPACSTCADESEAAARESEVDPYGPDGDNPNGIGAGDRGIRS